MTLEWDYTKLANAFLKRPGYALEAIDSLVEKAGLASGDPACDIGAGTGRLSSDLAERDLEVHAVEPNDAMRANGIAFTEGYSNVQWFDGRAEETGRPHDSYAITTFGSSFTVADQTVMLKECKRILRPRGWFACMWNHRDLLDVIQKEIEAIIRRHIPDYGYGLRRVDQTDFLTQSGFFESIDKFECPILHEQSVDDIVEAWRSHATVQRQAGDRFDDIISEIEGLLKGVGDEVIDVPYTTRMWVARFR